MAVPNVVERKTLDYIPYYIHLGQFVSFNRTQGRETKKDLVLLENSSGAQISLYQIIF
jgi:hypothetical protein